MSPSTIREWSLLSIAERKLALRSYFAEPYLSHMATEDVYTVCDAINAEMPLDRDYDKIGSIRRADIGA